MDTMMPNRLDFRLHTGRRPTRLHFDAMQDSEGQGPGGEEQGTAARRFAPGTTYLSEETTVDSEGTNMTRKHMKLGQMHSPASSKVALGLLPAIPTDCE